jgi:hypothetical protein
MKRPPLFAALLVIVVPVAASAAEHEAADSPIKEKPGLSGMLGVLGSSAMPSLKGLISPENMGLLTDNLSRIKDIFSANRENEANALSGNETELKLLADNQPELLSKNHVPIVAGNKAEMSAEVASGNHVLSGNRLLSDVKVEIHLHVNDPATARALLQGLKLSGEAPSPSAVKPRGRR